MYIADGSIDAALRFLERTEQTIKGLQSFPPAVHRSPLAFLSLKDCGQNW